MVFVGLHVGQCGIQQGHSFWALVENIASSDEHQQLTGCVTRAHQGLNLPLCINVDLESKAYMATHNATWSNFRYPAWSYICSGKECGAGGVFGRGFRDAVSPSLPDGTSVVEAVLEGVRRHAEESSSSAHFFLTHSLAGGTGSGAGAAILEVLRDTFPKRYIVTSSTAASDEGEVPCQACTCTASPNTSQHSSSLTPLSAASLISHQAEVLVQEYSDCALLVYNRLCPKTAMAPGKSHQDINSDAARGLAGLLLPLQGDRSTQSAQPMADLATFVTPEPALRFAELWVSPASKSTSLQKLVQQLASSIPRYTNDGCTVKTGCSLVVARGQLPGPAAPHSRQSEGRKVIRDAYLSKQKDSCRDRSVVTARHSHLGLPLSTASISMRGPGLPGPAGSLSPGEHKSAKGVQEQPLVSAATNRSNIGDFWSQHVKQAAMKLQQNAYVHWYERAGCGRDELVGAVHSMQDAALSYDWSFHS